MKKAIVFMMILSLSGCGKRYDTLTTIKSETVISQDASAPISAEVPLIPTPGATLKQSVGNAAPLTSEASAKSLNGKKLVEVTFIKRNGSYSVLEVVESGERFMLKGDWGSAGDKFRIER